MYVCCVHYKQCSVSNQAGVQEMTASQQGSKLWRSAYRPASTYWECACVSGSHKQFRKYCSVHYVHSKYFKLIMQTGNPNAPGLFRSRCVFFRDYFFLLCSSHGCHFLECDSEISSNVASRDWEEQWEKLYKNLFQDDRFTDSRKSYFPQWAEEWKVEKIRGSCAEVHFVCVTVDFFSFISNEKNWF